MIRNTLNEKSKIIKTNSFSQKITKIAAIAIISLGVTTGCAYTGKNIYDKLTQTSMNKISKNYNLTEDMQYNEWGVFYKKITTYEEYLENLNNWSDLVKMEEADFKNNFLLIINLENPWRENLYVSDINADQTTTYIKLRQVNKNDKTYTADNKSLSVKISKDKERENIEIEIIPGNSEMKGYTLLENITEDYITEQAFNEGCVVEKSRKIISGNAEKLDKFVEDTKNGISSSIRIVSYGAYADESIVISDVIYEDGEYSVSWCILNSNENYDGAYFLSGTELVIEEQHIDNINNRKSYEILDKNGRSYAFCIIHN